MPGTTELPFGYAAFGRWYDAVRESRLEPALDTAQASLDALLRSALDERDLARIRRRSGRIKSKPSTWRKIRADRYAERIGTLDDIAAVIDDLVGVRLTCTNRRDIEIVQEVLDALPGDDDGRTGLWMDRTSIRDYVSEPRPSGYRGWHANLIIGRAGGGHERSPVTFELQVRTLLQDGWGELTHEDTYKNDGDLPPLVEVLGRRMADLLATIDDVAEDLRDEFERLSAASVADIADADDDAASDRDAEEALDAAETLATRWRQLDRPVDLAALAWELQRDHGPEITDDWFGHRTFKRFLRHSVPEAEITTAHGAYLLPPGAAPDGEDDVPTEEVTGPRQAAGDRGVAADGDPGEGDATGALDEVDGASPAAAPAEAMALHRVDHTFPLLASQDWSRLFTHLAEAWRRTGEAPADDHLVRRLVQSTCDRSSATGDPLARRHVEPVVRALLDEHGGTPRPADQLAQDYATVTQQRMVELRVIGARNRRARSAVRRWIAPAA